MSSRSIPSLHLRRHSTDCIYLPLSNREPPLAIVFSDDVFTYTDTTRLTRIATILDEAAERFQIILLTCHPERYRGLPNAEFFDLEQIISRD